MFDELTPQKEPADMFTGIDEPEKQAGVPQAVAPASEPYLKSIETVPESLHAVEAEASNRAIPWKGIVLAAALLVVIGIAAYLSYLVLSARTPTTPEPPSSTQTTPTPSPSVTPPIVTPEPIVPPVVVTPTDADKDGLTDQEEATLGTDPTVTDTDDDGLFDREEVKVYNTDPLNPDTDGDSYSDGTEVKGGYNPNGSGKLFAVPAGS